MLVIAFNDESFIITKIFFINKNSINRFDFNVNKNNNYNKLTNTNV